MGTNFYLKVNPCPHCGTPEKRLHIGKSSAGWAFSLHVIPEEGLNGLDDWQQLFPGNVIEDEYGERLTAAEMLARIRDRHPDSLRHSGRHCVGHGPGAWDLIQGEFS